MNDILTAIINALNTPVPRLVYIPPNDWQYAFTALGGMILLVLFPWAILCFSIRNGIDGWKWVLRVFKTKKPLAIRKILLGSWKPKPAYHDPDSIREVIKGL